MVERQRVFQPVPLGAIPTQRGGAPPPPLATPPRNGFGIAALVFAVVGLLLGLVPLTGFLACSCAVLAVVFGAVGAARTRSGAAAHAGMAITGAALGVLALVLGAWGVTLTLRAAAEVNRNLGALGFDNRPVTPPEPPAHERITRDGVYLVGSDIEPGTYRTKGPATGELPNCYWARGKDASGDIDSILANGNSSGPAVVTIKPEDRVFETEGCRPWTKVG